VETAEELGLQATHERYGRESSKLGRWNWRTAIRVHARWEHDACIIRT